MSFLCFENSICICGNQPDNLNKKRHYNQRQNFNNNVIHNNITNNNELSVNRAILEGIKDLWVKDVHKGSTLYRRSDR